MDTQQTVSSGYVCGTTRKDALGIVVLDIRGPKDGYAYVYDENGNIKYNFQPFESMILNVLLPNFNQKTGAAVEKYGYTVVSEEAINIDDYLLINA